MAQNIFMFTAIIVWLPLTMRLGLETYAMGGKKLELVNDLIKMVYF